MKFDRLVEICAGLHCFSPGMLGAGEDMDRLRVQMSRWVRAGKLIRIHKGWYTLANAYRRITIDNFVVACVTNAGSYVSMQSALSHHGMIPEHVPETTCVTTGRPKVIDCPFGRLSYRHLKQGAFWGFEATAGSTAGQHAWMARPEKALLDLVYLSPGGVDMGFIAGAGPQLIVREYLQARVSEPAALRQGAQRTIRRIVFIPGGRLAGYLLPSRRCDPGAAGGS